jgi:mono/diheme cytochrome c family protein
VNKVERLPSKHAPTYAVVSSVPEPDKTDRIAYGKYLATTVMHCIECHTSRGANSSPELSRIGSGGNAYPVAGGGIAISANITPGDPNGVARWTDDQLKRAITTGVRPDGAHLIPVMDFDMYAAGKPEDLDAVVAYLRTLKPLRR